MNDVGFAEIWKVITAWMYGGAYCDEVNCKQLTAGRHKLGPKHGVQASYTRVEPEIN